MKVYLELPVKSRGIGRVRDALVKYAPPSVQITQNKLEANLIIFHVVGRHDRVASEVYEAVERGQQYAIIQYCLRSTMQPSTIYWVGLWNKAKIVWSYYNLPQLCIDDKIRIPPFNPPNFYYAPLGIDSTIFKEYKYPKSFKIFACSQHALSEGARECAFAVKRVGGKMIFLGHELRRGDDIKCIKGMSDEQLAEIYSQCEYVSGLRRVEGFELPVIEGLMCGARPIVFDRPEMRQWFNEFAIFIPETSREQVIDTLEKIFKEKATPVTKQEIALAKERFNWSIIIKGFWDRLL
jgi:hypothetical protein